MPEHPAHAITSNKINKMRPKRCTVISPCFLVPRARLVLRQGRNGAECILSSQATLAEGHRRTSTTISKGKSESVSARRQLVSWSKMGHEFRCPNGQRSQLLHSRIEARQQPGRRHSRRSETVQKEGLRLSSAPEDRQCESFPCALAHFAATFIDVL